MPIQPKTDHAGGDSGGDGIRPFGITGPDAVAAFLFGTGDPRFDQAEQVGRTIYVDILDPCSGRTWFGATRSWFRRNGVWHWALELSLAADTADAGEGFGREAGVFEITAYCEEKAPNTGRVTTVLTRTFGLTIAASGEVLPHTASVPVVLARLRQMGLRKLLQDQAGRHVAKDSFIFSA